MSSKPRSLRLPELDVLRAAAVILVLGHHRFWSPVWTRVGWTGVQLFFALSGFLVSGLLFSEYRKYGEIHVGRFFLRRGFKIYPAFYFFVLATVLYQLRHGAHFATGQYLAEAFFYQNYRRGVWEHTWSLAVEEHFYVLLPLSLLFLTRLRPRSADPFRSWPYLVGLVGLVVLGLRIYTLRANPVFSLFRNLLPTQLNLDGLAFGAALSYLYHFHYDRLKSVVGRWRIALLCASAAAVAPALFVWRHEPYMLTIGMTLVNLGFTGILAWVLLAQPEAPLWLRPLTGPVSKTLAYVGQHSYSIYLWHMCINEWGMPKIRLFLGHGFGATGDFFVYFLTSIALGILATRLIETPALALRERLLPSRSGSSSVAGEPAGSASSPVLVSMAADSSAAQPHG